MNLHYQTKNCICPLCNSESHKEFYTGKKREYLRCTNCQLVFVPKKYILSEKEEKARYDTHENFSDDPGYRNFLQRMATPIKEHVPEYSSGLDFGCGPTPVLANILTELRYNMSTYDIFYNDNKTVFNKQYDFITTTEVIEHLLNPKKEIEKLWSLLKPGGTLGIMTKLVIDADAFSRWHYKNDSTHIRFFSIETFKWLAKQLNAELYFYYNDVMIFKKSKK